MTVRIAAAIIALPLAACAAQMDREDEVRAPPINVVGPAEGCITTRLIENTVVHDDYTIDFEMSGGRTYRNTLPNRCYSLGFEERFAHSSTIGRLCSQDTIRVLYADGSEGAVCGLGEFLPVEIVGE